MDFKSMNNPNLRFSTNNSLGYSQNNHIFTNGSHNSNMNLSSFRSDSNLIRPIPKKVDLSRMLYQQFIDPYPKQNPSNMLDMLDIGPHNLLSKMYQNVMAQNIAQNTTGNRLSELPYQPPNHNLAYNDPRYAYNQFTTSNNTRNRLDTLKSQFYTNSMSVPSQNIPVLSNNMDSFMYNNLNHQIRQNQLTNIKYTAMKNGEENAMKKELYEEIKSSNKIQYYPKTPLPDDLIESHFSMSLNSQLKVDFKNKDSLIITSKQERITRKPVKQQLKNDTEKSTKLLKRARKSKNMIECFDSLNQNNSQEMSHTLCATPSDSSISPNSMVSCRSTITPQTVYPNFNTLVNSQSTNKQTSIANTEKSDKYPSFQKSKFSNIKLNSERENQEQLIHESHCQGLPLKKRIKWQIELDESYENLSNNETKTNAGVTEKKQSIFQLTEVDNRNEDSDSSVLVLEDPLKTFQKTFLPMEKNSNSSDTESDADNDSIIVNCKYQFSLKDQNDFLSVDNNI